MGPWSVLGMFQLNECVNLKTSAGRLVHLLLCSLHLNPIWQIVGKTLVHSSLWDAIFPVAPCMH